MEGMRVASYYGCGSGLLFSTSILKLWMLLDSCASRDTVCSTVLSSSSSRPSVAMASKTERSLAYGSY